MTLVGASVGGGDGRVDGVGTGTPEGSRDGMVLGIGVGRRVG